jgi:hypothetical protein
MWRGGLDSPDSRVQWWILVNMVWTFGLYKRRGISWPSDPLSSSLLDPHTLMSLCLTKHHALKTYCGSGGIAPRILDLGTRWRWVVSFTPRPHYLKESAPRTHWIGGWVGPKAVMDAVVKRKIRSPRRESNPRTPIVQPLAQRYTDWAITSLFTYSHLPFHLIYPQSVFFQLGRDTKFHTQMKQ